MLFVENAASVSQSLPVLSLDTLVDIAGVLGFVLSVAGWISTWIKNRKRLKISILDIKAYKDVVFLLMVFENKSRLPIAITRVALLMNGRTIECTPIPQTIWRKVDRDKSGSVIDVDNEKSLRIPIQLQELGAVSGQILFEHLPELPEDAATSLNFLIATNRGKAFQTTLELPEGWASRRIPY